MRFWISVINKTRRVRQITITTLITLGDDVRINESYAEYTRKGSHFVFHYWKVLWKGHWTYYQLWVFVYVEMMFIVNNISFNIHLWLDLYKMEMSLVHCWSETNDLTKIKKHTTTHRQSCHNSANTSFDWNGFFSNIRHNLRDYTP